MSKLAQEYRPFDIEYITKGHNLIPNNQFKDQTMTPFYNDVAKDKLNQPESSMAIKEAAETQETTPFEETANQLFDPQNPVRENYLRAKYQMFVNEKIRTSFAGKILIAKDHLLNLKETREKFIIDTENFSTNFTSNAIPTGDQFKQKKKEPVVTDMSNYKYDSTSRNVNHYNEFIRILVSKIEGKRQDQVNLTVKRIQIVLNDMEANHVKADSVTNSLLFKKNIQTDRIDEATLNLLRVNQAA